MPSLKIDVEALTAGIRKQTDLALAEVFDAVAAAEKMPTTLHALMHDAHAFLTAQLTPRGDTDRIFLSTDWDRTDLSHTPVVLRQGKRYRAYVIIMEESP